jgi:DNA-binding transcriptional ArsR family regulator
VGGKEGADVIDTFAPVPNWLLRRRDVPATAKLLYARLRQYQGDNATAWPGIDTLAAEIGVHRCRVSVHLRNLERLGLIHVERRVGYRASNRYRLLVPTGSGNATSCEMRPVAKCNLTSSGNATSPVVETPPKEIIRKEHRRDQTPPVPAALNVPELLSAWNDYQQHRREKRSALTPTAARQALNDLAKMGPSRAVKAIRHSIGKGWTGIFEPTGETNTNRTTNRNAGTFNDGKANAYAKAAR